MEDMEKEESYEESFKTAMVEDIELHLPHEPGFPDLERSPGDSHEPSGVATGHSFMSGDHEMILFQERKAPWRPHRQFCLRHPHVPPPTVYVGYHCGYVYVYSCTGASGS